MPTHLRIYFGKPLYVAPDSFHLQAHAWRVTVNAAVQQALASCVGARAGGPLQWAHGTAEEAGACLQGGVQRAGWGLWGGWAAGAGVGEGARQTAGGAGQSGRTHCEREGPAGRCQHSVVRQWGHQAGGWEPRMPPSLPAHRPRRACYHGDGSPCKNMCGQTPFVAHTNLPTTCALLGNCMREAVSKEPSGSRAWLLAAHEAGGPGGCRVGLLAAHASA